jgi:hypothetical protein
MKNKFVVLLPIMRRPMNQMRLHACIREPTPGVAPICAGSSSDARVD